MRHLLCYGDSNTFGVNPDGAYRYDEHTRWPALLAKELGPFWSVIEEGLPGRNSGLDDPLSPIRNGRTFLPVALSSHRPLDWVVLMLGSNDFKSCFHQEAPMVARRVIELARLVASYDYGIYPAPQVLVVAPLCMEQAALETHKFDAQSLKESAKYPKVLEFACEKAGLPFLNASLFAHPGKDGQHLDVASHRLLSRAILQILG